MNNIARFKLLGLSLLAALAWSGTSPVPALAQDLVFAADEWCPYNCEAGAELPGLVVEMIAEIFGAEGLTTGYRVVPWARAIEEARGGAFTGIIGAGHTEAPDFIFPETPAFFVSDAFYVPLGSNWRFEGMDSLRDQRFGVIRDYSYGNLFDTYIEENRNDPQRIFEITGEAPLPRLVQMLATGRLDLVVEDRSVMSWLLAEQGAAGSIQEAAVFAQDGVFVAFSPANPRSPYLAELFDRGLQTMRANGRLTEILARYGLDETAVSPGNLP